MMDILLCSKELCLLHNHYCMDCILNYKKVMKKKSRKQGSNSAKEFVIHITVESIGDFPAVEARILTARDMTKSLMESFDRVTGTSIVEHLKL